jgi:hypothetical protein
VINIEEKIPVRNVLRYQTGLEKLNDMRDINSAWENIKDNIKASAKEKGCGTTQSGHIPRTVLAPRNPSLQNPGGFPGMAT